MQQGIGIWSAALSSALGGSAIAATRLIGGSVPPEMLGALRFGLAGLLLAPAVALMLRHRLRGRDLLHTAALGLVGFGIFPLLYNSAIGLTTASRAAMALCTMPLMTMLLAAALGLEKLSLRRSVGVVLAMTGVAVALLGTLDRAPEGAWRGDLLMLGGTSLMASFNVLSRNVIPRVGVVAFTCGAMLAGGAGLALVVILGGKLPLLAELPWRTWGVVLYLGIFGGVGAMLLWSFGLKNAPVTVVAVSVTISPVTASILAALLLDEPLGLALLLGLVAVAVGIWMTAARPRVPVA